MNKFTCGLCTHRPATTIAHMIFPAGLIIGLLGSGGLAHALTLTNRDPVAHLVTIIENGEKVSRTYQFEPDQTLDDFCDMGCTIILENGAQEKFSGDEVLYLDGGRLVVVQ